MMLAAFQRIQRRLPQAQGIIPVAPTLTMDEVQRLLTAIMSFQREIQPAQAMPVKTARYDYLVQGRTLGSHEDELALLGDVAQVMRDASICGLGQTAANAVQSAISKLGVFANGKGS